MNVNSFNPFQQSQQQMNQSMNHPMNQMNNQINVNMNSSGNDMSQITITPPNMKKSLPSVNAMNGMIEIQCNNNEEEDNTNDRNQKVLPTLPMEGFQPFKSNHQSIQFPPMNSQQSQQELRSKIIKSFDIPNDNK